MSSGERQRVLIHVPIVHSAPDMGSLGRRLPVDPARQQRALAHWADVQQRVQRLRLDWHAVKIYQDGLPDAAPEVLRRILAEVDSPNYDLLRWLVAQGAELVGTEAPTLLREEYELLRAVLTAESAEARALAVHSYAERAVALLAERDAYIARRIADTLPLGRTGLLFIGQQHRVTDQAIADITVCELSSMGDVH